MTMRLCLALVSLAATVPAQVLHWPGFRGPERDGVVRDATPPSEWGADKNLKWRAEMPGAGASSPIVVGEHVYVACYSGYGLAADDNGDRTDLKRHLVCVARDSGEIVWDSVVSCPLDEDARQVQVNEHGFASPTPVTDGKRIYAYYGRAGVLAFDFAGTELWRADLGTRSEDTAPATNSVERQGQTLDLHWGSAASPLLHAGLVIVNASQESNSIQAFDVETGERVWRRESANLEGSAVSPAVFPVGSGHVLVIVLGGEVWGLDPKTGDLEWSFETGTRGGMSPTPLAKENTVYCFGGGGSSFALKLDWEGEPGGDDTRALWSSEMNCDIPSPVLYDGKLLLVDQGGSAICLEAADAEVVFRGRLDGRTGKVYASPVVADGRLYVTSRERGTFVYSADGRFELLARNELDDESRFDGSPVIVGSELFLRSDKYLYCLQQP